MKHLPRKRFGQNFLTNSAIIQQIIEKINPKFGENILEIGPGLGALTKPLIEILGKLCVIELDRNIIKLLENMLNSSQINIYSGDALKFDYNLFGENLRIVGNLPYNISTPLLFYLSQFKNIVDMTFMLQKEVVERICAKPNNAHYGKLSIMLQYQFTTRELLDVPPESFYPKPKVDSAIVYLKPRTDYDCTKIKHLNLVVSSAFNMRRKTIANSLRKLFSLNELEKLHINPQTRAQNISIKEYLALSNLLILKSEEN